MMRKTVWLCVVMISFLVGLCMELKIERFWSATDPGYIDLMTTPYSWRDGKIVLNDQLSKQAAEYGYRSCLGNEFGFQMEHAWCWDRNALFNQSFPYPIDPRKALANQRYLFTGDSMSRLAFRGFNCMLNGCAKPNDSYLRNTQGHGEIERYNAEFNITTKYEWAPFYHQVIANLTKKKERQENVFIAVGVHHRHLLQTLVHDTNTFANELETLVASGKIQNVFFQTAPRMQRAREDVVGIDYVNSVLLVHLARLYPNVLILNGRWSYPVYDMKDGLHSLSMAHATALRYGWAKTWQYSAFQK